MSALAFVMEFLRIVCSQSSIYEGSKKNVEDDVTLFRELSRSDDFLDTNIVTLTSIWQTDVVLIKQTRKHGRKPPKQTEVFILL